MLTRRMRRIRAGSPSPSDNSIMLVYAKFYVFTMEQVCLIFLSMVSSTDNLLLHEGGFIGRHHIEAQVTKMEIEHRLLAIQALPWDRQFICSLHAHCMRGSANGKAIAAAVVATVPTVARQLHLKRQPHHTSQCRTVGSFGR